MDDVCCVFYNNFTCIFFFQKLVTKYTTIIEPNKIDIITPYYMCITSVFVWTLCIHMLPNDYVLPIFGPVAFRAK